MAPSLILPHSWGTLKDLIVCALGGLTSLANGIGKDAALGAIGHKDHATAVQIMEMERERVLLIVCTGVMP